MYFNSFLFQICRRGITGNYLDVTKWAFPANNSLNSATLMFGCDARVVRGREKFLRVWDITPWSKSCCVPTAAGPRSGSGPLSS